jgi:hypothetical protein
MSTTSDSPFDCEPVQIRIIGGRAIGEKIFPRVAQGSLGVVARRVDLASFRVLGFNVSSYLEDYALSIPVKSGDLKAGFINAPFNQGRLVANFDFSAASLSCTLVVRIKMVGDPHDVVAGVLPVASLERVLSHKVQAQAIRGSCAFTVRCLFSRLSLVSVDSFNVQFGSVSVLNGSDLMDIADKLGGIGRFLNVPGASNVNDAVTRAVNTALSFSDMKGALHVALDAAIKRIGWLGQQTTATLANNKPLRILTELWWMTTARDFALSAWNARFFAKPSGTGTGLNYSFLPRPDQPLAPIDSNVDLEAYIPYSMIDRLFYEAVMAGMLEGLVDAANFAISVTATAVPRANRDPANLGNVLVEFSCAVRRAFGTPAGTANVEKNVIVFLSFKVKFNLHSGIFLEPASVKVTETGTRVTVAGHSLPVSDQDSVNALIERHIYDALRPVPVMPRAVELDGLGLFVQVAAPKLGTKYVMVPMTIGG